MQHLALIQLHGFIGKSTFVWARESPDISYTLAISPSPSISAGTQATLLPEDTLLAGVVTLPAGRERVSPKPRGGGLA